MSTYDDAVSLVAVHTGCGKIELPWLTPSIAPFREPEKPQEPKPAPNPAVDYLKAGLRDRESVRESYDMKCKAKESEIVALREQIEKYNVELKHLLRCHDKAGQEVEQFKVALAPYESEG